MDAIIDQFLDYAQAGSGEATHDADLKQLLRECVERYAAGGQVVLSSLDELPDVPLGVQSMRRAVENLIENALRYGGPDVLIECRRVKHLARVSVMDRGPGILAGEIDALKKPFARGSNSAGVPGSGLGLAIVERVVDLHFGHFTLLPRAGGGLEARIELPLSSLSR
jgi:two-component system osmolarity sensor histidine kinase EnvZ